MKPITTRRSALKSLILGAFALLFGKRIAKAVTPPAAPFKFDPKEFERWMRQRRKYWDYFDYPTVYHSAPHLRLISGDPVRIAEYRARYPFPKFTHHSGFWWAGNIPILRTQQVGWSTGMFHPVPFDRLPDTVIGAYCALNGICPGDFRMAYRA